MRKLSNPVSAFAMTPTAGAAVLAPYPAYYITKLQLEPTQQ